MTPTRVLVPTSLRRRLREAQRAVARPYLRRRVVRVPMARVALEVRGARIRRLRRRGIAVGVERLQGVFVINLARRPDRLERIGAELRRMRIDATRFEAIDDPSGIRGCTRSHAALMSTMAESGWNAIMVCEDDAHFVVDRDELDALVEAFLADDEAEVACLGYWHREVERRSLLFMRTTRSFTTSCYLVKASIASDLRAIWEEGARELGLGGDREVFGLDHAWVPLQRARIFLIPIVRAVRQEAGYSDIWDAEVVPEF